MKNSRRIIVYTMLVNGALWAGFWIDLTARLVPYVPHTPAFEEPLPVVVFGGRALPASQMQMTSLHLIEVLQAPSFLVVHPLVRVLNRNAHIWDQTFWGMSPWSYLLIFVMLLSFPQWYLVAGFVAYLLPRLLSDGSGLPRESKER